MLPPRWDFAALEVRGLPAAQLLAQGHPPSRDRALLPEWTLEGIAQVIGKVAHVRCSLSQTRRVLQHLG